MTVVSYQFTMPYSALDAAAVLKTAACNCNAKIKELNSGGFEFGICPWSGAIRIKHATYISEANGTTVVRIRASGTDTASLYAKVWDRFLIALEQTVDRELPIISGDPFIVSTAHIGGGIERESTGSGFSASGAIAGGLLFGEIGAVAGGYSAGKRISREVLSDRAIFLIHYSNGLVEEREVKKNSKLYAEVIAKLGADFTVPRSRHRSPAAALPVNHIEKLAEKKKMPVGLQILCGLIIAVTVFLCASILSSSEDAAPDRAEATSGINDSATPSVGDILVDNEKLKASFVVAEDAPSLGVFYITLKIENKTDVAITINLEDASVDGETIHLITTGVPLVIQPGNSGQTGFVFSMVNLSISSMSEAEKASFRVIARDNNTYNTVCESELLTIDLHQ